jgi:hypothetical protein
MEDNIIKLQELNTDGNIDSIVSPQSQDLAPDSYKKNKGTAADINTGLKRVELYAEGQEELGFISLKDAFSKYNPVTVTKTLFTDPKAAFQEYNPWQVTKDVTETENLREIWDKYKNPLQPFKDTAELGRDIIGTPESRAASWQRIQSNLPFLSILTGLVGMRVAFYTLVTQNVFGLATKLNDEKTSNPENYKRIVYHKWKMWGGDSDKLIQAINKGKKRAAKRADQYEEMSTFKKGVLGVFTGGIGNLLGGATIRNLSADGDYLSADPATVGVAAAIVAAAPLVTAVVQMLGSKLDDKRDADLMARLQATQEPVTEGSFDFANLPANSGYGDEGVFIGLTNNQWLIIGGVLTAALAATYFVVKSKKK